ncbi:DHH family phosphoesterase [Breznakiella homolactica]|uniref:DHH family phosphoesterase n=1 Tax=Breznakiella homolactica TaxID=2798577 RepID=A0A7T8BBJ7_9SPIR|nr:DHHA1 domain-containing protein [Breznakiella homolactica]QQO10476.1 DHH family phosphoesterase [Breznakiella homolactica]
MGAPDAFTRLRGILDELPCFLRNPVKNEKPDAGGEAPPEPKKTVVIQPHDYPDHDAVASAFGLAGLLSRFGFQPQILYRGLIRSHSLWAMITELDIPMVRVREGQAPEDLLDCPCIVVDGNPNNTNARQITNNLIGVVDHHANSVKPDCPFVDIRTSYGSCATIIADYWDEAELFPNKDTATALLMGIEMDTDFLSRRVSPPDLDALHRLFFRADWQFGTRVVKASLSKKDLPAFAMAAANARIQGGLFFTVLTIDTTQEVVSILADFFLRLREISVSVIIENQGERHHVSVRSRVADISAAKVIQDALTDIGQGGGHDHMAGGDLDPSKETSEEILFQRFVEAVENAQENQ